MGVQKTMRALSTAGVTTAKQTTLANVPVPMHADGRHGSHVERQLCAILPGARVAPFYHPRIGKRTLLDNARGHARNILHSMGISL